MPPAPAAPTTPTAAAAPAAPAAPAPAADGRPAASANPVALELTGERTLPGIPEENYWFRRHEAAYAALAPFTVGAVLLEAGCGEGYGADLLARSARRVVAVDYDPAAVTHAAARYPSLTVVRGDLQRLPLADGSVEVVATLQVLEHLHDQAGFLRECARVLRPAGTLLLTTPNRLTFSPGRDTPVNPFHTREFSPTELAALLDREFAVTRLLGLRHGRRLAGEERRHGSLLDAQLAEPPQRWPAALRRRVEGVTVADFAVHAGRLDDCLDLVAVAVSRSPR